MPDVHRSKIGGGIERESRIPGYVPCSVEDDAGAPDPPVGEIDVHPLAETVIRLMPSPLPVGLTASRFVADSTN